MVAVGGMGTAVSWYIILACRQETDTRYKG